MLRQGPGPRGGVRGERPQKHQGEPGKSNRWGLSWGSRAAGPSLRSVPTSCREVVGTSMWWSSASWAAMLRRPSACSWPPLRTRTAQGSRAGRRTWRRHWWACLSKRWQLLQRGLRRLNLPLDLKCFESLILNASGILFSISSSCRCLHFFVSRVIVFKNSPCVCART